MSKIWNFGILGPGKIANRFADAFQFVPKAKVQAIASRDAAKAMEFGDRHHIEKRYDRYHDLVKDPTIDIIYIATPHPFHHEHALLCLAHGKAVLCEKPLAMNLRQVKEMVDLARTQNLLLMEGMWSRFFPAIKKALEMARAGEIGEIKSLQADFGFSAPINHDNRLYNMALGGGAQLDVGVYPLFLALLFLGKPNEIKSFSHLASTGADATTHALLSYRSGAVASVFSSIVADSPKEAHILGTEGSLLIHSPWYKTQHVTVSRNNGEKTELSFPHSGNGFEFQIEEVVRCLDEGKKESDLLPHSFSLLLAEVADEIKRQGGVKYAAD